MSQASKRCSKCGGIKPLTDFYKKRKNTYRGFCKVCHAKDAKARRMNNLEKYNAISRSYYRNNKEKCLKASKIWFKKNEQRMREYYKKWSIENKERRSKLWQEWYYSDLEKNREIKRVALLRYRRSKGVKPKGVFTREKKNVSQKKSNAKAKDRLKDSYLKRVIRQQYKIPVIEIPQILIDLERQKRTLQKQFNINLPK